MKEPPASNRDARSATAAVPFRIIQVAIAGTAILSLVSALSQTASLRWRSDATVDHPSLQPALDLVSATSVVVNLAVSISLLVAWPL